MNIKQIIQNGQNFKDACNNAIDSCLLRPAGTVLLGSSLTKDQIKIEAERRYGRTKEQIYFERSGSDLTFYRSRN